MNLATCGTKNQRSKMTQKRFCRGGGYHNTPSKSARPADPRPQPVRRTQPPNGSQALRCKPRAVAQDIGLQRRYPIWRLRARPSLIRRSNC